MKRYLITFKVNENTETYSKIIESGMSIDEILESENKYRVKEVSILYVINL